MLAMTRALLAVLPLAGAAAFAEEPEAALPPGAPAAEIAPAGPEADATEATPDPRQARLDALFERLADPEAENAEAALRGIAEIWSSSGSDSMDLLLRRGRDALQEEALDKAVEHFEALTRLDPDFAEGWNALATAQFLRDEYWLSVAHIRRVLALEPRHFGAMLGLGVIFERIGEEEEALRVFREALRLNPRLDQAQAAVDRLAPTVEGRDI